MPPVLLVLLILVANLPPVVNVAGVKLPPLSTKPVANLPPVSMTQVANNGKNNRLLTNKSELEGKNLSIAIYTTQMCSKEIMKTFLIEDFFHLLPVLATQVVHLELRISPLIFEKI